jgi:hypothetical protein
MLESIAFKSGIVSGILYHLLCQYEQQSSISTCLGVWAVENVLSAVAFVKIMKGSIKTSDILLGVLIVNSVSVWLFQIRTKLADPGGYRHENYLQCLLSPSRNSD